MRLEGLGTLTDALTIRRIDAQQAKACAIGRRLGRCDHGQIGLLTTDVATHARTACIGRSGGHSGRTAIGAADDHRQVLQHAL